MSRLVIATIMLTGYVAAFELGSRSIVAQMHRATAYMQIGTAKPPPGTQVESLLSEKSALLSRLAEVAPDMSELSILRTSLAFPDESEALNLFAVTTMQAGDYTAAIGLLERAVSHTPDEPRFLNNLGAAYLNDGRAADAIATLSRVCELDMEFQEGWFNLGNAHTQQGNAEDAEVAYQRVLELNPFHLGALNNLGSLYRSTERNDGVDGRQHRRPHAVSSLPTYATAFVDNVTSLPPALHTGP